MDKTCFFIYAKLLTLFSVIGTVLAATDLTTDQQALLALKAHIIHDPNNALATNWSTTTSPCDWTGITCGSRHQRVTALNLAFMGLAGTIPPHLGNLSFLSSFNVTNNTFQGSLPSELTRLRRLTYLSLRSNSFNTEIPSWIGLLPKLEYIFLNDNSFIGSIPPSICNISSLLVIDLSFNLLSGHLPSRMFDIPLLRIIDLSNNQLSGPLPSVISNTSSLEVIDMGYNGLSGTIPTDLFKDFPKLTGLYLSYNQFLGRIPTSFSECKQLQVLSLSVNNFTGSIPKELGNLTMLMGLYLGSGYLEGEIPSELGNLQSLEVLGLSSNRLSGSIPPSIFNISSLKFISLTANQLSGDLPSRIGFQLPNLQQLYLGGNRLSGTIPSSISNASSLLLLELALNSFSGVIPHTLGNLRLLQWLNLGQNNLTVEPTTPELSLLSSLTNCKDLTKLVLSANPLNGVLPSSIGNLSASIEELGLADCNIKGNIPSQIGNLNNLAILHLELNELNGSIPASIGRLQKLQGLYLRNNHLKGQIPSDLCQVQSLVELYIGNNYLEGSLPACLDNLISLRTLSLGSNRLTSTMPSTLWSLKDILLLDLSSNSLNGSLSIDIGNLKVVTAIDLSRNQLSGDIPATIGGLKDLRNLSLAGNRFQGPIPSTFGGLTSLELLNLSNNNLSGTIPKSLEGLIYLKYFNASFNELEGEIPSGGPFANFSAESFMANNALCGASRLEVPPCKTSTLPKPNRSKTIVISVVVIIVSIVLIAGIIMLLIRGRKRVVKSTTDQEDIAPLATWRRISYQDLDHATGGFSPRNLLGIGSFGSVYKGTLVDGANIAVKVFNKELKEAFTSFEAECEVMRNVRHRNLVKIISSCSNDDFKALVMELMPNGSLETWLYSDNHYLNMEQRLNIMIHVASALEYLHHDYSTPVVHCDIKPGNVLLDENMVAHLSDFGIAKLLREGESMTQTQTLATIGYIAPEYGIEGKVSRKGDVYSFGVMLMEIFTRKKPTDEIFSGELSLKQWVSDLLHGSTIEIIDTKLLESEKDCLTTNEQHVTSILSLAMDCTAESPEKRINMKDVVTRLTKIRALLFNNGERT